MTTKKDPSVLVRKPVTEHTKHRIRLLAKTYRQSEIADMLGLPKGTVAKHVPKGSRRKGPNELIEVRLWSSVRFDPSGCWIWTGHRDRYGYGQMTVMGKTRRTHVLAWEDAHGTVRPKGMCVCHECDVPACINPTHLWLGTTGDNTRDAEAKGRRPRGEEKPTAKLTEQQVAQILELHKSGYAKLAIANIFGVSDYCVGQIVQRKTWRHVPLVPVSLDETETK